MAVIFVFVGLAIYSDYHPELLPERKPKLAFGASIMLAKYSPYIIAGIILLLTIFREVVVMIFQDVKEQIKKLRK